MKGANAAALQDQPSLRARIPAGKLTESSAAPAAIPADAPMKGPSKATAQKNVPPIPNPNATPVRYSKAAK